MDDVRECEHGVTLGDECWPCEMDIETVAAAARAFRDWSKPITPGSAMSFLKVKNWERFQHYKQRNPPWIRLYNELLDDYAFSLLQDASKWHAVGIWLLASRFDNRIPADPKWIGQRINARSQVDVESLISAGFLERYRDASNVLADCTQDAKPETEAETERDTETDKETTLTGVKEKNGRKRRGQLWHIVPAAWPGPTDAHRRLAGELGVDCDLEQAKFRDFEFSSPRSDADRAFSNWLRNAAKYQPPPKRTSPKVDEMPQSRAPRTGRPVRTDGHDPEAEKLQREREEDAAVQSWAAAHPDDSKAIVDAIAEEMRTDLRWRGTPAGIIQGVARGLYRTKVLERIGQNGAAAIA